MIDSKDKNDSFKRCLEWFFFSLSLNSHDLNRIKSNKCEANASRTRMGNQSLMCQSWKERNKNHEIK
jgi:hypothetical protein